MRRAVMSWSTLLEVLFPGIGTMLAHLIYSASRVTEASLKSLIFPTPRSNILYTHTHICKDAAMSQCQTPGLFLHSSFAQRLDQDFQKRWPSPHSLIPSKHFVEEKKNGRHETYYISVWFLPVALQNANVAQRESRCAFRLRPMVKEMKAQANNR